MQLNNTFQHRVDEEKEELGSSIISELIQSLDDDLKDQGLDPNGLNPQRNDVYNDYFERVITALQDYEYDNGENGDCDDDNEDLYEDMKHNIGNSSFATSKTCKIGNIDNTGIPNMIGITTLLSRIKDELTMTANSYKKLYESSVTFGIQKALTARRENEDLRVENKQLKDDCKLLKDQNEYLLRKICILEEQQQQNTTGLNTTAFNSPNRHHHQQHHQFKRNHNQDMITNEKVAKYKLEIKRLQDRNESIKHQVEECLIQGHNEVCNAIR